jgi:hypothetical protein
MPRHVEGARPQRKVRCVPVVKKFCADRPAGEGDEEGEEKRAQGLAAAGRRQLRRWGRRFTRLLNGVHHHLRKKTHHV